MTTPEERAASAEPHEIIWAAPEHSDDGWLQSGTWHVEHSWREDDCAYIHAATAEARLAEALARVAVLEAALSFYGDRGNWSQMAVAEFRERHPGQDPSTAIRGRGLHIEAPAGQCLSAIDLDRQGSRARAALRRPEK